MKKVFKVVGWLVKGIIILLGLITGLGAVLMGIGAHNEGIPQKDFWKAYFKACGEGDHETMAKILTGASNVYR